MAVEREGSSEFGRRLSAPLLDDSNSELAELAYAKKHYDEHVERKMMHRIFQSLDPTGSGKLQRGDIPQLFLKLGEGALTEEELKKMEDILFKNGPPTFEELWKRWNDEVHITDKSRANFKLISSHFEEPFHQQQLVVKEEGTIFTPEYRVLFFLESLKTGEVKKISPWHDIPLYVKDVIRTQPPEQPLNKYNFICEIPKWTRAKFEIATVEPYNPIKQDVSKGALRFYQHGDMLFNYGAFPQTWESTEHAFGKEVPYKGDNDPIDAIEIGTQQLPTGSVTPVKVLGVLGMIDDGEMDWKVICISISDPLALFMNEIDDVFRYMPGALECLRSWLRDYKICTGKPPNEFAFGGEYKSRQYAQSVIKECHNHWRNFHIVRTKRMAS